MDPGTDMGVEIRLKVIQIAKDRAIYLNYYETLCGKLTRYYNNNNIPRGLRRVGCTQTLVLTPIFENSQGVLRRIYSSRGEFQKEIRKRIEVDISIC